jgi:two-component system chemotaxis response regulator CheV
MAESMQKLQLEIGGSFFELIEFSLSRTVRGRVIRGVYGVNVAKVREVVRMPKINALASRIKGVAGVFELRGIPIPAVNLSVALGDDEADPRPNQQIIVTEFSQKRAGFVVDTTHRIRRIAWEKVLPPSADAGTCISGMTLIDNNEFLFILDLERILLTLEHTAGGVGGPAPQHAYQMHPAAATYAPTSASPPARGATGAGPMILLADDSQFIRNGVKQALLRDGFRVLEAGDGAEALSLLEGSLKDPENRVDLVVTDVEMPRMDGLSFTRKVREHPSLNEIPIILHTSLSGKQNQAAGHSVGANGYVVKNDLRTLFALIREILGDPSHALSA